MMFFRFLAFVAGGLLLLVALGGLFFGGLYIRAAHPNVDSIGLAILYWRPFLAALIALLLAGWLIKWGDITKPGRR